MNDLESALKWADSFKKYGDEPCPAEVLAAAYRAEKARADALQEKLDDWADRNWERDLND